MIFHSKIHLLVLRVLGNLSCCTSSSFQIQLQVDFAIPKSITVCSDSVSAFLLDHLGLVSALCMPLSFEFSQKLLVHLCRRPWFPARWYGLFWAWRKTSMQVRQLSWTPLLFGMVSLGILLCWSWTVLLSWSPGLTAWLSSPVPVGHSPKLSPSVRPACWQRCFCMACLGWHLIQDNAGTEIPGSTTETFFPEYFYYIFMNSFWIVFLYKAKRNCP